jgi:hypothetical protein
MHSLEPHGTPAGQSVWPVLLIAIDGNFFSLIEMDEFKSFLKILAVLGGIAILIVLSRYAADPGPGGGYEPTRR